jgi:hypothetical protein
MDLVTSRYHAADLIHRAIEERGLVPIGITVGAARYLKYELAANLGALAPFGLMKLEPREAFDQAYRQRLDSFGVDAIRAMIASVVDAYRAKGAVLLCFENVHKGEHCHRRVLAEWWERDTSEPMPELAAAQLRLT